MIFYNKSINTEVVSLFQKEKKISTKNMPLFSNLCVWIATFAAFLFPKTFVFAGFFDHAFLPIPKPKYYFCFLSQTVRHDATI